MTKFLHECIHNTEAALHIYINLECKRNCWSVHILAVRNYFQKWVPSEGNFYYSLKRFKCKLQRNFSLKGFLWKNSDIKWFPWEGVISKGYIPKGYCMKGIFLTSHSFNHRVYDDRCTKLSDKHPKSQGPLLDSTKRKNEIKDELFWVGDRRFADFYRGHYRSFWQWSLRLDLLETAGSPHFSQPPPHLGYLWHGKRLITAFWPLQKKAKVP